MGGAGTIPVKGVKPQNEGNYAWHIAPKRRYDKQTRKGNRFSDLRFRSVAQADIIRSFRKTALTDDVKNELKDRVFRIEVLKDYTAKKTAPV